MLVGTGATIFFCYDVRLRVTILSVFICDKEVPCVDSSGVVKASADIAVRGSPSRSSAVSNRIFGLCTYCRNK
jgi:hypothetical protein